MGFKVFQSITQFTDLMETHKSGERSEKKPQIAQKAKENSLFQSFPLNSLSIPPGHGLHFKECNKKMKRNGV